MRDKEKVKDIIIKNIKNILKNRHISQKNLAEMVGISQITMCRILKGERELSSSVLVRVAVILNVSLDDLCDIDYEFIPEKSLSDYSTDELLAEIKRRMK